MHNGEISLYPLAIRTKRRLVRAVFRSSLATDKAYAQLEYEGAPQARHPFPLGLPVFKPKWTRKLKSYPHGFKHTLANNPARGTPARTSRREPAFSRHAQARTRRSLDLNPVQQ